MKFDIMSIIDQRQQELQDKIRQEQEKLKEIQDALNDAIQFANTETNTITHAMQILKDTKNKKQKALEDIAKIEQTITTLKELHNGIDSSIVQNLKNKIEEITNHCETLEIQIKQAQGFLMVLTKVSSLCPSCRGSGSNQCTYCDGVGVVTIGKILFKEGMADREWAGPDFYQHPPQQEKVQNEPIMEKRESNNSSGHDIKSDLKYIKGNSSNGFLSRK